MSSIYEICKVTQIVSFLISNISCTKQSNFLLHYLKDRELFVKIIWGQ